MCNLISLTFPSGRERLKYWNIVSFFCCCCFFVLDYFECESEEFCGRPVSIWLTKKYMSGTDKSGLKYSLDFTIINTWGNVFIRSWGDSLLTEFQVEPIMRGEWIKTLEKECSEKLHENPVFNKMKGEKSQ